MLSEAQKVAMPKLYSQEQVEDPRVEHKFFQPDGAGTWFLLEIGEDGDTCFGWVTLGMGPHCDELGYWSLAELEAVETPHGLGIERDLYFQPKPLSEAIAQLNRQRGAA